MKLNKAIELGKAGHWQEAQVRVNPESRSEWFVMVRNVQHKTFILADNEDKPLVTNGLDQSLAIIRSLNLKEFTVFL